VAVDKADRIFVADCTLNRIAIFKPDQTFLGQLGGPFAGGPAPYGSGPGQFNCPFDIATDGNDYIYVADLQNRRVQAFTGLDSDVPLDFIQSFQLRGTDKQLCWPYGVAVDASHNIWVSGGANRDECHVVAKFDRGGRQLLHFGGRGDGPGQFFGYLHVATDTGGNAYVSDFANGRVQKFDTNGTFLSSFGRPGTGDGDFYGPHGLAFDPAGNLWVAETGVNYRIQQFTAGDLFAAKFGGNATGPGQFTTPYDVAADSNCTVYAVDTSGVRDGSERVHVFGQSEAPFCRPAAPRPPAPGGAAAGDGLTPGAVPPTPDEDSPRVSVMTRATSFSARNGFALPIRVNEDATIRARGKVNISDGTSRVYTVSARAKATKGRTLKLRLKGKKKTNAAIANALKRGKKLKAKVTITAADTSTNATTKRVTLKLTR